MTRAVEATLARHRAVSVAMLALLTLLAWAWLATGAGMGMAPQLSLPLPTPPAAPPATMPGMDMPPMESQAAGPAPLFMLTFVMWWVMMVAMMLPSAAPMILLHVRAATAAGAAPATGSFLAGYLLVWGLFSVAAAALQVLLQKVGAMDMALFSQPLSAAVLIATGFYQLSPLKDMCLSRCRNPAQFLTRYYEPGTAGALRMGIIHGAFCAGCCWLLMALLFVGGVMNLAWIAFLTLLVAAEKLLPGGQRIAVVSGVLCLVWGVWIAVG